MQGQYKSRLNLDKAECFDTLIPDHHILRKLDQVFDLNFVRDLTISYYKADFGRPSIDPTLFFCMLLIGYLFNIKSNRHLCEEIKYNIAYRWYCRLSLTDTIPHHSSLSRIRRRYGGSVFMTFFDKVVNLCQMHNLVGGKTLITDGMLINANASVDSMISKNGSVTIHDKTSYSTWITSIGPKKLSNVTHVSKTDKDSTLAMKKGTSRSLKYKIHTSIDAHKRIILDNRVITGAVHETNLYLERVAYIQNKFGLKLQNVIADRAYGAISNIKALHAQGINAYIPLFSTRSGKSLKLAQHGYIYNKVADYYECPAGKHLLPYKHIEQILYKIKPITCNACKKQKGCLLSRHRRTKQRYIIRSHNQEAFEQQLEFMTTPTFVAALRERMWKIEGINAEAKNTHGLGRAKYRGLTNVQIQAYMVAAVQNLKRLIILFFTIFIRHCNLILNDKIANF